MDEMENWTLDVGAVIRSARENMRKAIEKMNESLAKHRAQRSPLQIDASSKFRYDMAVKRERAAGLSFVHAEAARVRRELGL